MPWPPVYRASNKLLQALAGLLLIAAAVLATPSAAAPIVGKKIVRPPAATISSWTRAEFHEAVPRTPAGPAPEGVGGIRTAVAASSAVPEGAFFPTDVGLLPQSLHGKVFFRLGPGTFECSATLVESKNANSVFTAGHCVFDPPTGQWASDLVFVPGYENGFEPHGRYAAIALNTTASWAGNPGPASPGAFETDYSEDIGVATLAGTPVTDLGGAERIAFDLDPAGRPYTIYGYPGLPAPPYDGERLVGCRATVTARDRGIPRPLAAYPCDMSHGASGGGWMTGGYLNSVLSYVYCDSEPTLCDHVFGPYFSNAAKALYTSPAVGGGVRPTISVKHAPPRKVTKRKVAFRFAGRASTPVSFRCSLDRRPFERCGARTTVSRLRAGRHTLRARAEDQTGFSSRVVTRRFTVSR